MVTAMISRQYDGTTNIAFMLNAASSDDTERYADMKENAWVRLRDSRERL